MRSIEDISLPELVRQLEATKQAEQALAERVKDDTDKLHTTKRRRVFLEHLIELAEHFARGTLPPDTPY